MGDKTFLSERKIKIYLTTSEKITTVAYQVFSCMPEGTVVYVATEANKTFVEDVLEKNYYYGSVVVKQSDNVTVELLTEQQTHIVGFGLYPEINPCCGHGN